jgi:hypothetical protein
MAEIGEKVSWGGTWSLQPIILPWGKRFLSAFCPFFGLTNSM